MLLSQLNVINIADMVFPPILEFFFRQIDQSLDFGETMSFNIDNLRCSEIV